MRRDTRPCQPFLVRITYYACNGARRSASFRVDAPSESEADKIGRFRLRQDKRRNPALISAVEVFEAVI